MKEDNKKYIDPEIVNESNKKAHNFGKNKMNDIDDQVSSIKKAILLKGISALALPILIFVSVIGGIAWLIMYVIDTHPYDYIVTGIFLFFILSPIYKLMKMFK